MTLLDIKLGERLRGLRLAGGHSVLKLAMHIGCSPKAYLKIEEGAARVSAVHLLTLAGVLGVAISDFYDGLLD